ncbi:unnamed protein product [Arctia plantaginis]|uniref:C2H2-type domain-containing protein n=1 Tax=Arctia plantaginis TaxID=874455 RepID=A0A8S1BCA8_ARCPL|nr:unnamed protein product [Arctia plantaginis]
MDDCSELAIKKICCTCLSKERKLFQLCRISDGVNNLYLLLSYDSEAFREGFYKDTASLFICWECRAVICRIARFRQQACIAQRQLSFIADGRLDINAQHCLSHLSRYHTTSYKSVISEADAVSDNFIDCGANNDIKTESEEDIPLSELHSNLLSDNEIETQDCKLNKESKFKKKRKLKRELYFSSAKMSEHELKEVLMSKKTSAEFVGSNFKCDSCIEMFHNESDLAAHNTSFHTERPKHIKCEICFIYTKENLHQHHKENHYNKHNCLCCGFVSYNQSVILAHLKDVHGVNLNVTVKKKTGRRKSDALQPGVQVHNDLSSSDKGTSYLCKECNKYFDNKNQRWKHVQRHHREGHKCITCGKRFAFKNNLARHQLLHEGPPPRTECPVCHKMIRVDLLKVHSRIHSEREQHTCVECSKSFVSRASYEHHLKYTQAHAATNILKYKCTVCDKGYRSRGELRDHVNYQHMGKTQHKCPICGKALATRRCITRHVRRAHDGVKESARDKICQQCGKAFRDKKGLREHELIHTGERPLSCELCGCTFRQSASLYTHRKRVHKIYPPAKRIQLV